jgi:anti-anti-sigma regulatory factor
MLMITEQRNVDALIFLLAGALAGKWATEFNRCWRNATSSSRAERFIVDLTEVTFVDDLGRKALSQVMNEGGELIARDVLIKSIVEEIASESSVA